MKSILFTLIIAFSLFAQSDHPNERFTFLQQIYFENSTGQYNAYLESELQAFLQKYPNSDQTDQVILMLGDVQFNRNKPYSAFIQYLKIPTLFPKSSLSDEARKKLNQFFKMNKNAAFLDIKDTILTYLNQKHYFETRQEAAVDLYNFLFSLELPELRLPLLRDLECFAQSCQENSAHGDIVLFLKGKLNVSLKHFSSAEADFRELLSLYKHSLLAADALFQVGWIDYKYLKKTEDAKNAFVRIINAFPNNENTPKAQFYLAELYVNRLDSLNAGIDNYRLFVDAFPDHPLFKQAFKRLTLLLFKTKRYEEAVTLIGMHLNKHAQDSTFYAVVDSMARVLKTNFRKYNYAARCYVLLASANPQSAQSPFYLYNAARIYKMNLKDIGRAKDICQRLQKSYPDSPYAVKCQLLIKQRVKK